ncbi:MAG: type VI secretion system tip protein VgrG [Gilvibacter sp.]
MAKSDTINVGGLVTFTVKVDGKVIPDEYLVYSIHVEKMVNRIPLARVSIIDGSAAKEDFTVSSSKTFVPGGELQVEVGYDLKEKQIFKGIITEQNIKINDSESSMLIVEARDKSIALTVDRKCKTFSKKKDSDILSSIIKTYSGLSSSVTATTIEWPEQVQYYTTDWDFVLTRAETNGMIVTPNDGKISVAKPDADTASKLTITYGDNLMECNTRLNSVQQLSKVTGKAWDFKTQKIISASSNQDMAGAGNLTSSTLAKVAGGTDFVQQTTAPLTSPELTSWTKAQLIKSGYSKILGEVKFYGTDLVNPSNYITLKGLGDRFDGDHLVSGVIHDISDGNWVTEATLGLPNQWFVEEPDVMAPPTSALLPGAAGLFNAVVKKIYEDPDNQYRILIDIPNFDEKGEGIWARLSTFYATNGAGAFFLPEVNDEVIVGFLNEDPRFPIILGSLYSSSKNKPYKTLKPNEKNSHKAIASKSGLLVEFNDEDKILTIVTPSKNTVVFSDKDKSISLKDQNNNSIVMDASGIEIKSPKNITLNATQKVIVKGAQGVDVSASGGDVTVKGVNIKENANVQFVAKGGAQAEVSGGAQLTLKGAMVMIN